MKKLLMVLIVLAFSFSMLSATPGNYDDIKVMMQKQAKVLETYITGCQSVTDGKSFALVIKKFAADMKELTPSLQTIQKKYANMAEMMKDEPPAEIQAEVSKLEELSKKMFELSGKLMQYMQDPDVLKAQEELQKVMAELSKEEDGEEVEKEE